MKIDRYLVKRFFMASIGVCCMGLAVTIYEKTNFGADPFTCMNLGAGKAVGLSFGVTQLIINIGIILVGVKLGKHLIGIGTLINMTGVGVIADICTYFYERWFAVPETFAVRMILFLTILIVHSFGASIFFTASLGVGAYDILGFVLQEKSKINFRYCRMATDLFCVVIGLLLGSTVGIGTIITALFMGPIIQFITEHFSVPFLVGKQAWE